MPSPKRTSTPPKTTATIVPAPVPYLFVVKKIRRKAKNKSPAKGIFNQEERSTACPNEKKTATAKTAREKRISLFFPALGTGEKRKPIPGDSAKISKYKRRISPSPSLRPGKTSSLYLSAINRTMRKIVTGNMRAIPYAKGRFLRRTKWIPSKTGR